jgi:hypothetical protein
MCGDIARIVSSLRSGTSFFLATGDHERKAGYPYQAADFFSDCFLHVNIDFFSPTLLQDFRHPPFSLFWVDNVTG